MNEEMMKHLREAWRLAGEIDPDDQQKVFDEALDIVRADDEIEDEEEHGGES